MRVERSLRRLSESCVQWDGWHQFSFVPPEEREREKKVEALDETHLLNLHRLLIALQRLFKLLIAPPHQRVNVPDNVTSWVVLHAALGVRVTFGFLRGGAEGVDEDTAHGEGLCWVREGGGVGEGRGEKGQLWCSGGVV